MWTEGQKAVCVNDRFSGSVWDWADQVPKRGHIYTIQAVVWCPENLTGILGFGLKLVELKNSNNRTAFSAWRFEPLATKMVEALAEGKAMELQCVESWTPLALA